MVKNALIHMQLSVYAWLFYKMQLNLL